MKEALLVAGVPIGKIDRKSVVSDSIPVSTWLGVSGTKKILKAFKEPPDTGGIWINEGVCGVDVGVDVADFWYYKVVGLDVIGRGGWDNPDNDYDTNLWYEPTTEHHGLIMYDFVDEFYGTWSPQTEDPWEICPKTVEKQIKIDEATVSGNNYTFNYYTEGFKTTDRIIAMEIKKLEGSSYIPIDSDYEPIVSEWNNSGDFTFTITESGSYKMIANVLNVSDPNKLQVYLYVGEFELEFDVP